ncbi:hypothetical protein BN12_1260001 [Nostocoides japonicum T1-X7]|uniref:Uncharacterized protein n=1 Tax=Nostocoides japonicum T1-X7 TaxID=1194083 RepID=A0A077LSZ9_9MICO|nr:hypothetical protein BN12_1260001 [Tetrasphaera japonica T1-X7]
MDPVRLRDVEDVRVAMLRTLGQSHARLTRHTRLPHTFPLRRAGVDGARTPGTDTTARAGIRFGNRAWTGPWERSTVCRGRFRTSAIRGSPSAPNGAMSSPEDPAWPSPVSRSVPGTV